MRKYCIDCCKKHLGSASVLEDEVNNGYPQYELYVIGHLDQAASEIQGLNASLASAIREHRIHWMEDHNWDIPYEALWTMLDVMSKLNEDMAMAMAVTDEAMGKLAEGSGEVMGDTRKGLPLVTDGFVKAIDDKPGDTQGNGGWMTATVLGSKTHITDASEVDY